MGKTMYQKFGEWCEKYPKRAVALYIIWLFVGIYMWMMPSHWFFSWGGVLVGGYGVARLLQHEWRKSK